MVQPSKIVCVGKNYAKHAAEMGGDVPSEPLIFLKPPSSLLVDGLPIVIPPQSGEVHYEGEIGVVIGTRARNVPAAQAWAHISAVVPVNDVTARDLQRTDSQWSRAKGFDTFCPVGTPVPVSGVDLDGLGVTTRVNGEVKQHAPASDMAFDIPAIIEYISGIMTLEPGDLVATGTPDGIGPVVAGDTVEVEVHGVGKVANPVVAAD
ncbi:MAG: fumarylacetoacetate hydrolase family protein [Gemmatimonadetes bacterium]|nr:fumarylacetoacetate hydrolase family protein [Gemmatimonadota bacterium]